MKLNSCTCYLNYQYNIPNSLFLRDYQTYRPELGRNDGIAKRSEFEESNIRAAKMMLYSQSGMIPTATKSINLRPEVQEFGSQPDQRMPSIQGSQILDPISSETWMTSGYLESPHHRMPRSCRPGKTSVNRFRSSCNATKCIFTCSRLIQA